jgi:pSer/pThr/pTyr-binding forkhead associated (FHA) protein/tetratricopeptide (TPR) repeat protein
MHKLLIEDDEGKTVAVPLNREEITIGRMDGNTIRLTEQNVSRKHARLSLNGGTLRIEDLGSYNGTSLNGSALSGVSNLKDGDVILIGDYRLGIQEDRTSQSTQSSAQSMESAPAVPAVEDPLEGQPTIPISTLAAQTAFSALPARLVVASRFMSGTEFILDRPAHVVGRTPENDIILNHKSISRHHAKIVREGDRYVILDLESANGVRVGGVEHDRVDLQTGDLIELGEVRLRFLSGDSALYDETPAWYKNRRFLALGLGGGVVGLVLVMVFVFSGGQPGKGAPPVAENKPTVAPVPVVAPVVQPTPPTPPPPAQEPAPAEPQIPIADLLADAKKNAQAEKWEEALALIAKVSAQDPDSADAASLRKAVEAEKQYSEKLAGLKEAFANKSFEAVLQGTSEFPAESMYKPRALELHKSAQKQFVATHLEAAAARLSSGDCAEARREADLVLGLEAKNKKAEAVVKRCDAMAAKPPNPETEPEPVVAVAKPAPRRPAAAPVVHASAAKTKPAEGPKPEPASMADPDKLIKDAQQAWFRGQYAAAIDAARKALRVKPSLTNAYQIIAVCSCALHDADSAAKAYEKLDDRNKLYVKSACQKSGIGF